MKFSYSAVWDDCVHLIRTHGALMGAIAGVFIFLPSLLLTYGLPAPESRSTDINEQLRLTIEYYTAAWPWFLAQNLLMMLGGLAVLRLVFARETTVGGALAFAAAMLPFYFLLYLVSGLIVGFGLMVFILPGIYLFGRFAISGAVMVAEQRRNPLEAIARSFELSRGRGWAVAVLVILIGFVGAIITLIATMMFGIVFTLVAGQDLGRFLTQIVTSGATAALTVVVTVLYAAIYRRLAGNPSTAEVFQ